MEFYVLVFEDANNNSQFLAICCILEWLGCVIFHLDFVITCIIPLLTLVPAHTRNLNSSFAGSSLNPIWGSWQAAFLGVYWWAEREDGGRAAGPLRFLGHYLRIASRVWVVWAAKRICRAFTAADAFVGGGLFGEGADVGVIKGCTEFVRLWFLKTVETRQKF